MVSPNNCSRGRRTARYAVGRAGVRRRKKRRPHCNGTDRGCNIASRVSERTTARFLDAESRPEFNEGEHERAPATVSAPSACLRRTTTIKDAEVRSKLSEPAARNAASRWLELYAGETRIQFLGEDAPVTACPYPLA